MKRLILIITGLLVATAAWGQIAGTGTNTGPAFNKWDRMGMCIINNFTTSSSPSSCDGTLDLSTGCATPLPGNF